MFFDVFGTLVDWRTSVAREAERISDRLDTDLDWLLLRTPGEVNTSPGWRKSARVASRSAGWMYCTGTISNALFRASACAICPKMF
jgi:hypothetical protein